MAAGRADLSLCRERCGRCRGRAHLEKVGVRSRSVALRLLLMVMLDMLEGAYADVPALPVRALSILLFSISIAFRFMTSCALTRMPHKAASGAYCPQMSISCSYEEPLGEQASSDWHQCALCHSIQNMQEDCLTPAQQCSAMLTERAVARVSSCGAPWCPGPWTG